MGIWMAGSRRVAAVITPILDAMQTMPSFAYLAPLVLVFGIGPASAVVVTLIYAVPPLTRITAHGIRTVSPTTIEAVRSMGASRWQTLRTVQLPMARRTIIVGLNQCTMAALSMATIAALINGPGLGQPVAQALDFLGIALTTLQAIAERRVERERLRQLRAAGPDRGVALGESQHRGVWRRSRKCHDRRRVGGRVECDVPHGGGRGARTLRQGRGRERVHDVRARTAHHEVRRRGGGGGGRGVHTTRGRGRF